MNPKVHIVEDDDSMARALRINLQARGYDVVASSDGSTALASLARDPADIVILDLGLPDFDGVDVIHGIRAWSAVPILVLSARHGDSDKVAALDAGADDYLTKPFSIEELLARLRASMRRATPTPNAPTIVTPAFTIDLQHMRAIRSDEEVHLTRIEWGIVETLVRNPDRLITSRQLLTQVWGPAYADATHYLRVYMMQVRRKLEDDPSNPRHFLTETGLGYRFTP